ncbi:MULTISPECIES: DUF1559 domain-containing protein [Pirellulaceae]|nr:MULTISPECIES: DUF1559 domain-containing protein [Pirellulaceae]
MRARRGSGKTVVIVILAVVGAMFLMCAGLGVAILLPAVQQARVAAQRQVSINKMKQIGLALHNYHDTYLSFPPAFIPDENGQPRTSWRASILPFMVEGYADEYDYNTAWDDPGNQVAATTFRDAFASPHVTQEGYTPYVAVVGPRTAINAQGRTGFRDVIDGTSNTIFIIEDVNHPVKWSSPNDISPDEVLQRYQQGDFPESGILVLMADGAVRLVPPGQAKALELLMDRADGQPIPIDF